jgi:hypothetical protein
VGKAARTRKGKKHMNKEKISKKEIANMVLQTLLLCLLGYPLIIILMCL